MMMVFKRNLLFQGQGFSWVNNQPKENNETPSEVCDFFPQTFQLPKMKVLISPGPTPKTAGYRVQYLHFRYLKLFGDFFTSFSLKTWNSTSQTAIVLVL